MIDWPYRSDEIHDLLAPAIGPNRQSTPNNLAQYGQIRFNPIEPLRPTIIHAKPRDHFIKNQQNVVFCSQLPQGRQEFRRRWHNTHITCNRFQNDAGQLVPVSLDQLLNGANVVIGSRQGVFHKIFRNARGIWNSQRGQPRPRLRQQVVTVSVITALEFHDPVALRESSRDTDGTHSCLGSGTD